MHGSQAAGVVGAECVYPSAGLSLILQRGESYSENVVQSVMPEGAIALSPNWVISGVPLSEMKQEPICLFTFLSPLILLISKWSRKIIFLLFGQCYAIFIIYQKW